jgi:hypothetical protein
VSPPKEPTDVPSGSPRQVTDHDTTTDHDTATTTDHDPDKTTVRDVSAALDRLVLSRTLTSGQARAVLSQLAQPSGADAVPAPALPAPVEADGDATGHPSWVAVLGEVGSYVGAAFVLGGCVVLVDANWGSLTRSDRVQLVGLPAVAMMVVAALIGFSTPGGWSVRPRPGTFARRRLVATLATLATVLSATAVEQIIDEPDKTLAAMGTAAVVCLASYALCRNSLLHLALGVASTSTVVELTNRVSGSTDHAAWGFVAAGLLWVALAAWRVLDERTLGDLFGAATVYLGGEMLAIDRGEAVGYVVVGLVGVAGLVGYLRTRRVPILVIGVVALATVVPEAVSHYAGDTIQAGGTLLVTGLSIVSASMLGLLLHRRTPAHRARSGSVPDQSGA